MDAFSTPHRAQVVRPCRSQEAATTSVPRSSQGSTSDFVGYLDCWVVAVERCFGESHPCHLWQTVETNSTTRRRLTLQRIGGKLCNDLSDLQ